MKKFRKAVWLIILILAASAGILGFTAFALSSAFYGADTEGASKLVREIDMSLKDFSSYLDNIYVSRSGIIVAYDKSDAISEGAGHESFSVEDVNELCINARCAVCSIKYHAGDEQTIDVWYDGVAKTDVYRFSKHSIGINAGTGCEVNLGFFENYPRVTVYVPRDYVFEKVEINLGIGEFYGDEINAKEVDVYCRAGLVNINNINAGHCYFITEAGVTDIFALTSDYLYTDTEVGYFSAYARNEIEKVTLAAGFGGGIHLFVNGHVDNYALEFRRILGRIRLNGYRAVGNSCVGYSDSLKAESIFGGISLTIE